MILALLSLAQADEWLADAYVEMPWGVTVDGAVFASQGDADVFRILVHLDCEVSERERTCVVLDSAFQGRAMPHHQGLVDDELKALRDGIHGATLTMTHRDDGSLAATPDLDGDTLNNPQRELAEALLGRAMVGFDFDAAGQGSWYQAQNHVAQIPGAYGGGSMSAKHVREDTRITTQGQGTTRTPGGSPFTMQFGAEANLDERGMVDRWWWAVGRPTVSAAAAANYVQGGLLYRLEPGTTPLVGIGSGELDMSGPSLDAAVLGMGAYDPLRDLDVRPVYDEHRIWVRAAAGYERRPYHTDIGTGELLAGYGAPFGVRVGAGFRAHTPRHHTLLYDEHPVAARDAVLGVWYRPIDQTVAPHLGMSWLASFRSYEGASPDRIWIPAMAVDIGFDVDRGRLQFGAFGRGQLDMALTIAEHGPSTKMFTTGSLSAGLTLTTKAVAW